MRTNSMCLGHNSLFTSPPVFREAFQHHEMFADMELDAYLHFQLTQSPEPWGRNHESNLQLPLYYILTHSYILKKGREENPAKTILDPMSPPATILFIYSLLWKNCSESCSFLFSPNPHLPFSFECMRISLLP